MIWQIRDRKLNLDRVLLMGILNLTPDSFSDGGKFLNPDQALAHALQMEEEGASILDLGAESTRPGAAPVAAEEEISRILPVLKVLIKKTQIPVSIDTTKPEVAEVCLKEGAHIINDVSGLKNSGDKMVEVVRSSGAGLVIMHRRGNPVTMQSLASYQDVVAEVMNELSESIQLALKRGISSDQLVIDPGLGFSKSVEHNLEIVSHLEKLHELGYPVLLGPSRKAFIGRVTGRELDSREFGTAAVAAAAVMKGVHILRVHQIRSMKDAVAMAEAIRGEKHVRSF